MRHSDEQLRHVGTGVAGPEAGPDHLLLHQREVEQADRGGVFHQRVEVGHHDPAALGGHPQRAGEQLAAADAHRHDHLLGHRAPGDLADQLGRLLEARRGVRRPELHRLLPLELDRVDGDDVLGAGEAGALDRVRADAAGAEHDDGVAGCTSALFTAEPHPVITPQPSRHARSSG